MREQQLSGLRARIAGGRDGQGNGQGPLVILLHGFGAPGDDLVPLGSVIDAPAGTRWLFPEGPLSLNLGFGDARAWWIIDMARIQADRAAGRVRDMSMEVPKGLTLARERLLAFLKALPQHLPIDYTKTVIGGFSQGAMVTCDAVLQTDYPFAGLVQLSGNLLAQPVWGSLMSKRKGLPVFQSHGLQDDILPYAGAERLRDALSKSGLAVEWHSFRGGHEIPESVIRKLGGFLTKALATSRAQGRPQSAGNFLAGMAHLHSRRLPGRKPSRMRHGTSQPLPEARNESNLMLVLIHKTCGGPAMEDSPVGEVCGIPIDRFPFSCFTCLEEILDETEVRLSEELGI